MTTARAFRSPAASAWRPRTSLWPLLTALLACHAGRTTSTRSSVDPAAGYTATLTRDGGSWIVDYQFPEPQSALLFDTQHGAYRTRYWTPLDARTKLVNLDGLDGLFFDVPVREARIRIRPPTEPVAGTRPFLRFSDGSLAFYTGQLALLTVEDRRAAEALHGDSSSWHGQQPPVAVRFESDGPVVADRRETPIVVTVTAHRGAGPYLYPGPIPVLRTETLTAVLAPGLPAWLRDRVPRDLAAVDAALEHRWHRDLPQAVSLLAWEGPGEEWKSSSRRPITPTPRRRSTTCCTQRGSNPRARATRASAWTSSFRPAENPAIPA